jgi:hypothetical protein
MVAGFFYGMIIGILRDIFLKSLAFRLSMIQEALLILNFLPLSEMVIGFGRVLGLIKWWRFKAVSLKLN